MVDKIKHITLAVDNGKVIPNHREAMIEYGKMRLDKWAEKYGICEDETWTPAMVIEVIMDSYGELSNILDDLPAL